MKTRAIISATDSQARPQSAAFTLIELIISSSLMAVILGSAYLCFSASVEGRKAVESRADVIQTARVALELMSADLRAATPLSADNDFLGMDRQLDDVEADNLDFATHHYRAQGQAQADWCEVSYYLDKNAESGIVSLYRRRDPTPDPEPLVGGSKELIAENVRGLSCEFYDGFEWFETWGDPDGKQQFSEFPPGNLIGLPAAIRITLAIAPPEKPTSSSSDNATNRAPALVFQTTVRPALAAARWNGPKTGGRN